MNKSNKLNLLKKLLKLIMINRFLQEAIKSFLLSITKLIFRYSGMRNNHKLLLPSLLNILISKLPNLLSSNNSIHSRHINIHNNKPISLNIPLNLLFTLHQSLLPTDSLIRNKLILRLQNHLQNLNIKNRVIHDQNLFFVFFHS
jgi:hypothetical protein